MLQWPFESKLHVGMSTYIVLATSIVVEMDKNTFLLWYGTCTPVCIYPFSASCTVQAFSFSICLLFPSLATYVFCTQLGYNTCSIESVAT